MVGNGFGWSPLARRIRYRSWRSAHESGHAGPITRMIAQARGRLLGPHHLLRPPQSRGMTRSSTRRLALRPSSVSLLSTGKVEPKPWGEPPPMSTPSSRGVWPPPAPLTWRALRCSRCRPGYPYGSTQIRSALCFSESIQRRHMAQKLAHGIARLRLARSKAAAVSTLDLTRLCTVTRRKLLIPRRNFIREMGTFEPYRWRAAAVAVPRGRSERRPPPSRVASPTVRLHRSPRGRPGGRAARRKS